jgi:hypothetical protein
MSPTLGFVLCPSYIIAAISMTDPDAGSIWLFFGPLNAALYGIVGWTLWLFIVGGDDDSMEPHDEHPDRPPNL